MSYASDFDIGPDEADPRAQLAPQQIMAVADAFGLGAVEEMRDLGGTYNLSLLLRTAGDDSVLRAHRPWVTAVQAHGHPADAYRAGAAGAPSADAPGDR